MACESLDLEKIIHLSAEHLSKKYNLDIDVDINVLSEVISLICVTVNNFKLLSNPNIAKIAGTTVYLIKKFKPFHCKNKNSPIFLNEFLAIHIGINLCELLCDDTSNESLNKIPNKAFKRILKDLISGLRYHQYSNHSLISIMELICSKE